MILGSPGELSLHLELVPLPKGTYDKLISSLQLLE
jgi:hypothetical protein